MATNRTGVAHTLTQIMAQRISDFHGTYRTEPSARNPDTIADYLAQGFLEAEYVDVMVGYFELSFFHALSAISPLLYNSSKKVRIFCGHQMSGEMRDLIYGEDSELVVKEQVEEAVQRIWEGHLNGVRSNSEKADILLLSQYLVDQGRMEILPIVVRSENGGGIFHQKEYLFHGSDWKSRGLGSANMTLSGMTHNRESMVVSYERVDCLSNDMLDSIDLVENLANESEEGHYFALSSDIVVRPMRLRAGSLTNSGSFDEIADRTLKRLLRYSALSTRSATTGRAFDDYGTRFSEITLWDHQATAIEKLKSNNYVGLFELCTGAGKTLTSMMSVVSIWNAREEVCPVMVSVPSLALCDQWYEEACWFFPSAKVFASNGSYGKRHWRDLAEVRFSREHELSRNSAPILIGRHQTLVDFINHLGGSEEVSDALIIVDECHTFGEPGLIRSLSKNKVRYRIGLSATPDRYMDSEGTTFVRRYFDADPESLLRVGIKDAIDAGSLVPYDYEPRFFRLGEEDQGEYMELSDRIRRFGIVEDGEMPDELQMLLLRRVRLVLKAPEKLTHFRNWLAGEISLSGLNSVKQMLVFAPEGFESDSDIRILDKYVEVIRSFGLTVQKFIGGSVSRVNNLMSPTDAFRDGSVDVLIAMKCLDEGVDLPDARLGVFLSSTGNPRQYIQRRGRILRKADGKQSAKVVDFICTPAVRYNNINDAVRHAESSILEREFRRSLQFMQDSRNFAETFSGWRSLLQDFDCEELIAKYIETNG